MSKPRVYLDHASATPISSSVIDAMRPFLGELFYNASSTHSGGNLAKQALEESRQKIAYWFGCRPNEVVFTAGGTEANNLIVHGVMSQFPEANCLIGSTEHDSVIAPAERYNHQMIPVKDDGIIDVPSVEELIDDRTALISVHYANNETGVVQPIRQLSKIIMKVRENRQKVGNNMPIFLHTDACQAPSYLDIHINSLGVDAMTINAGKIYGPKQTGAIFLSKKLRIAPLVLGGGQEKGIRSGTENISNIIGFAMALDEVQNTRHQTVLQMKELQQYFIDQLKSRIQSVIINGSMKHRLPNNVHITLPGLDNERVMMELDNKGVLCSVGSACSASSEESSHVLRAMGLSDKEARSSLRFTMGRSTTKEDIDYVTNCLEEICARAGYTT